MTDTAQTPEAVAMELYRKVIDADFSFDKPRVDREYILSTYSECLRAAKGTYKTDKQKEASPSVRRL